MTMTAPEPDMEPYWAMLSRSSGMSKKEILPVVPSGFRVLYHVRAHDLGGGAAGNDSLEFAAFTGAAADVVQQFAEGHGTGNDFIIAGAPHVAGDADDARAGERLAPSCP